MIDENSLTKEWIEQKQKQYKGDPGIMESMIYALYLLDRLKITSLDFIFKGGTSLILLMKNPLRFSVDIDIIVDPKLTQVKLEGHLQEVVQSSAFLRVELDKKRSYNPGIPKAHYKFFYTSCVVKGGNKVQPQVFQEREILLDILFMDNPYPKTILVPIQTAWVMQKDLPAKVLTPDVNSIAGDKLVAFAPKTTGVPYGQDKEKEIIKQLFDVGNLFLLLDDLSIFKRSYHSSAQEEMKFRAERGISSKEAILLDTIDTALLIALEETHVSHEPENINRLVEIRRGLYQFKGFVFEGKYGKEHAQVSSAKAAYLAAIVLTEFEGKHEIFDVKIDQGAYKITHPEYIKLNKQLKFIKKGEALFYWYHTIKLLHP